MPNSLQALQALSGGGSANDPLELARLRAEQQDELESQLINLIGAGQQTYTEPGYYQTNGPAGSGSSHVAPVTHAVPGFGSDIAAKTRALGNVNRDISEDPFTGDAAQAEDQQQRGVMDYLTNPATIAKRNQEQAQKVELAAAPANAAGHYAVEAARENRAGKGDLLDSLITMGEHGGLQPGQHVSVSGVGSISEPTAPKPVAQKPTAASVTALEKAQKANGPGLLDRIMGRKPAPSNDTINALREVSTAEGVHPQLFNDALQLVSQNPGANAQQLLQAAEQLPGGELDPHEREQFLQIFSRLGR